MTLVHSSHMRSCIHYCYCLNCPVPGEQTSILLMALQVWILKPVTQACRVKCTFSVTLEVETKGFEEDE